MLILEKTSGLNSTGVSTVSGVALTSLVRLRQNEVVIDARTSPLNI
jgi:hypothetical protein